MSSGISVRGKGKISGRYFKLQQLKLTVTTSATVTKKEKPDKRLNLAILREYDEFDDGSEVHIRVLFREMVCTSDRDRVEYVTDSEELPLVVCDCGLVKRTKCSQ